MRFIKVPSTRGNYIDPFSTRYYVVGVGEGEEVASLYEPAEFATLQDFLDAEDLRLFLLDGRVVGLKPSGVPMDIHLNVPGQVPHLTELMEMQLVRPQSISSANPGFASCDEPGPNKNAQLAIRKNGNLVGTVEFAAGETEGEVNFAQNVVLLTKDILSVTGPAEEDTAFKGLTLAVPSYTI